MSAPGRPAGSTATGPPQIAEGVTAPRRVRDRWPYGRPRHTAPPSPGPTKQYELSRPSPAGRGAPSYLRPPGCVQPGPECREGHGDGAPLSELLLFSFFCNSAERGAAHPAARGWRRGRARCRGSFLSLCDNVVWFPFLNKAFGPACPSRETCGWERGRAALRVPTVRGCRGPRWGEAPRGRNTAGLRGEDGDGGKEAAFVSGGRATQPAPGRGQTTPPRRRCGPRGSAAPRPSALTAPPPGRPRPPARCMPGCRCWRAARLGAARRGMAGAGPGAAPWGRRGAALAVLGLALAALACLVLQGALLGAAALGAAGAWCAMRPGPPAPRPPAKAAANGAPAAPSGRFAKAAPRRPGSGLW